MNPHRNYVLEALWGAVGQHGWILFGLFMLTLAAALLKGLKPLLKGRFGEAIVNRILKKIGLPALRDIYLPYPGGVTQIDHVTLAGSAIVVIETKNYEGRVFGREREATWTVAYNRHSRHRFQNPLRQNYAHVEAVKAVVGPEVDVIGMVVFVGDASFPNGTPAGVYAPRELKKALLSLDSNRKRSTALAWELLLQRASGKVRKAERKALKAMHKAGIARRKGQEPVPRIEPPLAPPSVVSLGPEAPAIVVPLRRGIEPSAGFRDRDLA